MLKARHIFLAFIPALLLAGIALFIRVVQYEPLFPKQTDKEGQADVFTIPIFDDDPIIGSPKAPITVIAFEDFGCPACKEQNTYIAELEQAYPGKIKVIFKALPVTRFPFSTEAAHLYGYCAERQGVFGVFKNLAFTNGDNLSDATLSVIVENAKLNQEKLDECLKSPAPSNNLEKNKQLASLLNIQSVPIFFLNNRQIQTPHSVEQWKAALELY